VALDMYAHKRVERLGGVNVWGYRGEVLPNKKPNEIRIAAIGSDLAFGWGVAASETLAPNIRRLVALETDRPGGELRPVTAVTLAAMGLTPAEYASWISHFSYLRPDIVCIVLESATGIRPRQWPLPERRSFAWAAFGYAPILPLVLEEKGMLTESRLLRLAGSATGRLDRGLRWLVPAAARGAPTVEHSLQPNVHADAIEAAIRAAQTGGAGVVVVAPPYVSDDDAAEHAVMRAMIDARFGADRRVRLVDLGEEADMYDDGLTLNRYDFSTAGHQKAAEHVTPAVLGMIAGR
jgi:hypothetical protein